MVTKYQLNLGLLSENKKSIIFFGQKFEFLDKNKPFQPYWLEKKSLGHSGKSMALSKIGFSKNKEKKKKGYFPLDCLHHQSLTMKLTSNLFQSEHKTVLTMALFRT